MKFELLIIFVGVALFITSNWILVKYTKFILAVNRIIIIFSNLIFNI